MILKASQRSGGQDLAAHLLRTDENEHVEVHEIRGFASDDLHGAFKEAHAISRATKCRQYLFSMSLNPPETENVPISAFEAAIQRAEHELGLEGQPRAIVFHEKEGRRHAHCVWSRIDAATLTAKQMSHFKTKLTEISRELYLEHDWKMPRGLINKEARDPRSFTLEEWQQAKRTGQDPRAIKSVIQDCWTISDSRASFEHALQERGFWLAKGDRRGHVAIDHTGEVYSIARMTGKKAKDVRARLGDENELNSISNTKTDISAVMTETVKQHVDSARIAFKHRDAALAHNKMIMAQRHQANRAVLKRQQIDRSETEIRQRAARLPTGLKGVWSRITGKHGRIRKENEAHALQCAERDRIEKETLIASQLAERQQLQRQVIAHRHQQALLLQSLREDVRRYSSSAPSPAEDIIPRRRRQQRSPS